MIKNYEGIERIPISAIKQYAYCKRRFSLMFVDKEWASNYKIIEGDFLHEKVDNPFLKESRGDIYFSRSVPVFSKSLNLYGVADIIEFNKSEAGVFIDGKKDKYTINPIEYKNGKPEESNADNYQLCAVAICLEEMFNTTILSGDIYYGKLRKRVNIVFDNELRENVKKSIVEIHLSLENNLILKKENAQNCSLCSLINICLPTIFNKTNSVKKQILK